MVEHNDSDYSDYKWRTYLEPLGKYDELVKCGDPLGETLYVGLWENGETSLYKSGKNGHTLWGRWRTRCENTGRRTDGIVRWQG